MPGRFLAHSINRVALNLVGRWACVGLALAFQSPFTGAAILYVSPSGNDGSSGASWVQAKKTVGNAMGATHSGDQLWVAAGTYLEHVTLKSGVALYGGFTGTESALEQRDPTKNRSVLNGS